MFFKYNLFGFIWGGMILFLSLLPGKDLPQVEILNFDKIGHAFVYMVWIFLLMVGFSKQHRYVKLRYNVGKTAILVGLLYGTIIEVMQGLFYQDRFFDWMDIAANATGCFIGSILFAFVYIKI